MENTLTPTLTYLSPNPIHIPILNLSPDPVSLLPEPNFSEKASIGIASCYRLQSVFLGGIMLLSAVLMKLVVIQLFMYY